MRMGSDKNKIGRLDGSGRTLDEFLRDYDVTQYFRPSVTVDAVLLARTERGGKVLLIKRGGHPCIGDWAFPGGFVEENEACETAAPRELNEETGISGVPLYQAITVSTPGRDPRWRNITVVFYAVVDGEISAVGGDDAADARWFDFTYDITDNAAKIDFKGEESFSVKLKIVRDGRNKIDLNATQIVAGGLMAFDHAKVLCYLIEEYLR